MKRPARVTWDQLKVGAFIVISLGLLAFAVIKLGNSMSLFTKRYELYTLLASASGLRVGGSVSVAGQQAGTVKRIEFLPVDEDTSRNLIIVMDVDMRVRDQVRGDSRVQLRTLGLLGDKTLDISPGTPRAPVLQSGDTLVASDVLDYDRLIVQAADAVDDVIALTADLRTITSGLAQGQGTLGMLLRDRQIYDQLSGALTTSTSLLNRVRDSRGTLGRMLDSDSLYVKLVSAAGTVDSVARRFTADNGTIGRLLRDSTVYLTLQRTTLTADSLLRSLRAGEGSAGKLLRDDEMYTKLLQSVSDLAAILDDFRRNPSRYTRGIIRIF